MFDDHDAARHPLARLDLTDVDDPALEREWRWPSGLVTRLSELARSAKSRDMFLQAAGLELTMSGVQFSGQNVANVSTIWTFERARLRARAEADRPARRRRFSA